MYLSALTRCAASRFQAYYQRKRAKANARSICLARRRTNVLWALLRDNRTWQPAPPVKPEHQPKAA
ncbi:MAG TPA: hypothetical protein VIV12_01050 [Streptosporangiaceae bacterium]